MTSLVDRVNAEPVSVEDLRAILWALEGETDEDRSFELTVHKLAQLFPDNPHKVRAVIFRMRALSLLTERVRPGWWFLPSDIEGRAAISDLALRVAAELELHEDGRDVYFDEAAFMERALRLGPGLGSA